MHKHGYYLHEGKYKISDIRLDVVRRTTVVIAGKTNVDEDCSGDSYSDLYGSYSSVTVNAAFTILISRTQIATRTKDDVARFPDGSYCKLSSESCFTEKYGHTHWHVPKPNPCGGDDFMVLCQGQADKTPIGDKALNSTDGQLFSVSDKDYTFGLITTGSYRLCGYTIMTTDIRYSIYIY